jgi:two-component system, NarL family, invasion response regulator UvrY
MLDSKKPIKVAITDDHILIRKGLAGLINSFQNYTVLFEADNGIELIKKINKHNLPDIVVLDVNMPEMDGYETAKWLRKNYPYINVLALSMFNNESAVIQMLKLGVKGYVMKNAEPEELRSALDAVVQKGFYYSEFVTGRLVHALNNEEGEQSKKAIHLSEKELTFLKLVCSEMTYKDIALQMCVSHRTVDDYRISLFEKLTVRTRVGLVLYAIKSGIVTV